MPASLATSMVHRTAMVIALARRDALPPIPEAALVPFMCTTMTRSDVSGKPAGGHSRAAGMHSAPALSANTTPASCPPH